jgi:cytoskeletal protein CcmA (bactofilin family)
MIAVSWIERRVAGPLLCISALASLLVGCRPPGTIEEGLSVRRGGDLVAADLEVVVRDSIPGDVMVAGGTTRFTGTAGGDLLAAGGSHRLAGSTAGSVRAAGADVRLDTEVGRNITLAGGTVVVGRGARVGGNAYLTGGRVRLEGSVDRLVRIAGADVVVDGPVAGDVLVEAGRLRLGPAAAVEGDLRYRLSRGEELVLDLGSRVEGEVVALGRRPGGWVPWAFRVLRVLAFLLAGVVMVALLPGLTLASEQRVRARPLASFGLGIGVLLLVPILLFLLAIIIIGLSLALVGAALYAVTVYLAPVVVALWLGRLLLRGSSYPERGELVLAFLAGGILVGVLGVLPYVGIPVTLLATVLGLGAFGVALWEGALRAETTRA